MTNSSSILMFGYRFVLDNKSWAILLLVTLFWGSPARSQEQTAEDTLSVDLDKDSKMDTVVFIRADRVIVAKLSAQKFSAVTSKEFENIEMIMTGVERTATGFKFSNNWMRSGYECQFRYEPATRRIRLIGMTRYEFGNAAADGSGKSSVNLLTDTYVGDWSYMDYDKDKLVKIPTIKRGFSLPKTYLDDNVEKIYETYAQFCADVYNNTRDKMMKAKRK